MDAKKTRDYLKRVNKLNKPIFKMQDDAINISRQRFSISKIFKG